MLKILALLVLATTVYTVVVPKFDFHNYATLPDLGAPGFECDPSVMGPSKVKPTNVHAVRPADINLVMALGDSLTAANGAGATNALEILLQYRGLAFAEGGDKGLDQHITIPNVLQKFNSKLFGQSKGVGSYDTWDVAYLNMGYPGAESGDLHGQAEDLVKIMKEHPQQVDMKNDWKLLNIFIGGNDLCAYCDDPNNFTPTDYIDNIKSAIQYIKDNVPRVIVNLVTMFHFEMVRKIDHGEGFCEALHLFECGCDLDGDFTDQEISDVCVQYQKDEKQLEQSGVFDTTDDFTLVTQPFFNEVVIPPKYVNGSINLSFFAPDCFHFSQLGHAVVSSWFWKNMMEPVGGKTTLANLSAPALPLACPDSACPFIRTTKNSQNCQQFWTPAA